MLERGYFLVHLTPELKNSEEPVTRAIKKNLKSTQYFSSLAGKSTL